MPDRFSPYESGGGAGTAPEPLDHGESGSDQPDGRTRLEFHTRSQFPERAGEPVFAPQEPYRAGNVSDYEPVWVPIAPRRVRNRNWLHALLFGLTIVTTTAVGVEHWIDFMLDYGNTRMGPIGLWPLILTGFWYSATILTILGAHELGHYLACRYYRIDASLPYFLPAPLLTGTLGAFIRIRQPITTKRMLFDIGVAGPLAGFVFAVPALFLGISLSHVARLPAHITGGLELGEPLLFQLASRLIWGWIPDGYSLNMHPMAFAAWFGLLATALNLFPIGQLDGGHISYAVLKEHSTKLTYLTLAALLVLDVVLAVVYQTPALLLFTVLIVVMLFVFGPRHPPVMDEDLPLDRTRLVLAVLALLVFILCFTPVPIRSL
jgi:hypothetical protein